MSIEHLCLLLLNTDQLLIQKIWLDDGRIRLSVKSTAQTANCPVCGQGSREMHSHYMRYPTDLAWAEWPVAIHLTVKRFFCRNATCPKRTFAERFPNLVASYARRTQRVVSMQQQVGVNLSSRAAEYLLQLDQIGISDTTLNRLIRALPESEVPSIRVLGVDDWAKRKGQRYGTILVDLERGSVVDLLSDRTADTAGRRKTLLICSTSIPRQFGAIYTLPLHKYAEREPGGSWIASNLICSSAGMKAVTMPLSYIGKSSRRAFEGMRPL